MPLGRGKSGKEALCCLNPPADLYPAASPAAWGMPSHTVTARLRPAGHTYACSRGKPGSLPTDTSSPFAVSNPAYTLPTPQHGSAVSHRDPRPRPAGHAYAHSKGWYGSLPTDTGMSFAVSNPVNTPPAPPHGECRLTPYPRPRPAGHAYARSKRGSPAHCPPAPARSLR